MTSKQIALAIIACIGSISYCSDFSEGAVISYSAQLPLTVATTGVDQAFTLPGFDSNLGLLQSVKVTYVPMAQATIMVLNPYATPEAFTEHAATLVQISGPGVAAFDTNVDYVLSDTASPQGFSMFNGPVLTLASNVFTPANPASFAVNGNVLLTYNAHINMANFSGNYRGNVLVGGTDNVGGTVKVDYMYSVIPEPGTAAMLAAPMGLLLRRPRRV